MDRRILFSSIRSRPISSPLLCEPRRPRLIIPDAAGRGPPAARPSSTKAVTLPKRPHCSTAECCPDREEQGQAAPSKGPFAV